VASSSAALAAARVEFDDLRQQHRGLSRTLLAQVFESYRIPSFRQGSSFGGFVDEGAGSGAGPADDFSGSVSGATLREAYVSEEEEAEAAAAEDEQEDEGVEEENGGGGEEAKVSPKANRRERRRTAAAADVAAGAEVNLPCGCGDCCAPKVRWCRLTLG
jgi:hypothetical protein